MSANGASMSAMSGTKQKRWWDYLPFGQILSGLGFWPWLIAGGATAVSAVLSFLDGQPPSVVFVLALVTLAAVLLSAYALIWMVGRHQWWLSDNQNTGNQLEELSGELLKIWHRRLDRDTDEKKNIFKADAGHLVPDIVSSNLRLSRLHIPTPSQPPNAFAIGYYCRFYKVIASQLQKNGVKAARSAAAHFIATEKYPSSD